MWKCLFEYSTICLLLLGCQQHVKIKEASNSQKAISAGTIASHEKTTVSSIEKGSTFAASLRKAGVTEQKIHNIILAVQESIELRRLRPNTKIFLVWSDPNLTKLTSIKIRKSNTLYLLVKFQERTKKWQTSEIHIAPKEYTKTYTGTVTSSLWASAYDNGTDPKIIMDLAEIFSWVFDFSREVRKGDRWRLTVTELYLDGELIGRKPIEVAQYESSQETLTAVYFKGKKEKHGSYFYPTGKSLKRVFLKSPLKFGRVTSKFNRKRFHPILKRHVPHNGVDYGAPRGTPVHTVGEGLVSFAGRNGPSGIMVRIKHNTTYTTAYLHLNAIHRGIRKGKRVEQGEIIGYVGSTGRATGPHLHFSFYENGKFVDPLGRKFPSKDPVPKDDLPVFLAQSAETLKKLPRWEIPKIVSWYLPQKKLVKEPGSF